MKLQDLLIELKPFANAHFNMEGEMVFIDNGGTDVFYLHFINTKLNGKLEEKLLKCDEFKGVKKINFPAYPAYVKNIETGEILNRNPYPEEKIKSYRSETYMMYENSPLNEEIVLYSINLSPKIYQNNEFEFGVHSSPTMFSKTDFLSYREVKVIYDRETLLDNSKLNKDEFERYIKQTLDKVEHYMRTGNISYNAKNAVMLRGNNLFNQKENEKDSSNPGKKVLVNID